MKSIFIKIIKIYQAFSSLSPPKCRFYPTCSNYAIQSINKHGVLKGSLKTTIRICKCHPFHSGGYDPA